MYYFLKYFLPINQKHHLQISVQEAPIKTAPLHNEKSNPDFQNTTYNLFKNETSKRENILYSVLYVVNFYVGV